MRLVIDLQGAQGVSSRFRGIGRLSRELALAMAREAGGHEVLLALNGAFPDAVDDLSAAFAGLVGRDAIRIWHPTGGTAAAAPHSLARVALSEHVRAGFLRSLAPDLVHVSSLFEGIDDDIVTSLPPAATTPSSVATLYDLIPLIRREQYLDGAWIDAPIRDWYLEKVERLRRMSGFLAISESSRREAIDHLGTSPDRVFNIRAGVAETFRPVALAGGARRALLARYHLPEGFILFLGGGDMRKNEAGLIAAYGLLPPELRAAHKLAIVARADEAPLRVRAAAAGIPPEDLVLIPFVEEADLAAIYGACALFVFPSLHEGFGLPAAEAMACGAPVIGSDTTSLPEVIGRADALFDPSKPESIARVMRRALTDDGFRRSLAEHGPRHAARFTWADSARRAWAALESILERTRAEGTIFVGQSPRRPSLAMTSPLPPQRSGIADYTRQLLPALSEYYDITLVAEQPDTVDPVVRTAFPVLSPDAFLACSGDFDRVVHQIGNSDCHRFQFDTALPGADGVVVLHDVFLSNALLYLDGIEGHPERFRDTLLQTHGIQSVWAAEIHGAEAATRRLPCSLGAIQRSLGVLLHSRHARDLIGTFYGPVVAAMTRVVPTIRELSALPVRAEARGRLGLSDQTTIVATFGGVALSKKPMEILEGFLASDLARRGGAILAFVGETHSDLDTELSQRAQAAGIGGSVVVTGRTTEQAYGDWLAAADIAVQLRTESRGETSAAAADCLAAGLPTIVNDHGALSELPEEAVVRLPDRFETTALAKAIDGLANSSDLRRALGAAGAAHAAAHLSATTVARAYRDAIETFYAADTPTLQAREVARVLGKTEVVPSPDAGALLAAGRALSWTFPPPRPRRILLDIGDWSAPDGDTRRRWSLLAIALLLGVPTDTRAELVDLRDHVPTIAWAEATHLLGIAPLGDAPAQPLGPDDILLCPLHGGPPGIASRALAAWAFRSGAAVVGLALSRAGTTMRDDTRSTLILDEAPGEDAEHGNLLRIIRGALAWSDE